MFHRFLNTQMPLFGFPFLGRSGGGLGEVFYKHFPSRNPFLHGLSERFGEVGRSFSKFHLFEDRLLLSLGRFSLQSKIYEIRGQRVMLDFDLAAMYGVETRRLNEQVKRNIERFPEDFMFQLTKGELEILRSQIATSNTADNQEDDYWISQFATSNFAKMGLRKTPYAFTENGVAMLSSVLRSPLAIQVNIGIMRAFTEFRRMASSLVLPNTAADVAQLRKDFEDLKLDIEDILHDQNDINESTRQQLDAISTALAELQSKEPRQKPRRRIGFIQDDSEPQSSEE